MISDFRDLFDSPFPVPGHPPGTAAPTREEGAANLGLPSVPTGRPKEAGKDTPGIFRTAPKAPAAPDLTLSPSAPPQTVHCGRTHLQLHELSPSRTGGRADTPPCTLPQKREQPLSDHAGTVRNPAEKHPCGPASRRSTKRMPPPPCERRGNRLRGEGERRKTGAATARKNRSVGRTERQASNVRFDVSPKQTTWHSLPCPQRASRSNH